MMYFKLIPDCAGDYVAMDGSRYSIAAARRIRTAAGVNMGYAPFESVKDAMQAWEITPIELDNKL